MTEGNSDSADAVLAALEAAGITALVSDATGVVRGSTALARWRLGSAAQAGRESEMLEALAARRPQLRLDRHDIAGGLRVWLPSAEPGEEATAHADILAIASHDLRSPLANIRSYAGMMLSSKGPTLDPRLLRAVQVIVRNSDRGLHLIDDLVDLQRSEASELALEREPVALGEILRLAFEDARNAASDRGVILESGVPEDLPRVQADPDRLRRAIRALLETGIRRTPPGGHVRLTGEVRSAEAYLAVEDEGEHVDVREAALAFDRDHQILAARKLVAGVSMALAQVVARAHGGRVGCLPGRDRGAVHFLALPSPG